MKREIMVTKEYVFPMEYEDQLTKKRLVDMLVALKDDVIIQDLSYTKRKYQGQLMMEPEDRRVFVITVGFYREETDKEFEARIIMEETRKKTQYNKDLETYYRMKAILATEPSN